MIDDAIRCTCGHTENEHYGPGSLNGPICVYHANCSCRVFTSDGSEEKRRTSLAVRQMATAILAHPKLAGPWRNIVYHSAHSDDETWERDLWDPIDGRIVPLQLKLFCGGWGGWFNGTYLGSLSATPEEARKDADAYLRKHGYMIDDESGDGPLRAMWGTP